MKPEEHKPWVPASEHQLREHIRRLVGVNLARSGTADPEREEIIVEGIMAIREDLKVTFNREMR